DPEIAFLELRQEFGAEPHAQSAADHQEGDRDHGGHARVAYGELQDRLVDRAHPAHQPGLDLVHLLGQQQRRHHRRHGERGDHRAEQGVGVGTRHRAENLTLDALHGEQRDEGGDGDDHREEDGFVDFDCCREDAVQPVAHAGVFIRMARRMMGEVAEDVLHHDHGAVDDNAEIDGADRQQVGGVAAHHRNQHGEEQRHGNSRGHNQRAAQVAEEYPLDHEDQRDAEQHVVHHRAHGDGDEIAAIVERVDLDARRQAAVGVDTLDGLAHARYHIHGALELLHQHDAEDDVVFVVARGDAEARREADLDAGDVGQDHRQAALLAEHDVADVGERAEYADAAYVYRLLAHRDGAAAHVGVAGGDRLDDLRQRQPVGAHAIQIDFGLIFLGLAAEHGNVGHARHDA